MDVNDLRSAVTLLSLAAFVGIALWAWSRRNLAATSRRRRVLPDNDDEPTAASAAARPPGAADMSDFFNSGWSMYTSPG